MDLPLVGFLQSTQVTLKRYLPGLQAEFSCKAMKGAAADKMRTARPRSGGRFAQLRYLLPPSPARLVSHLRAQAGLRPLLLRRAQ